MSEVHLTDHTIVVGAGIIGLTIAWELARNGHSVLVLERDRPGSGATRTAGGMLGVTAEVKYGEQDLLAFEKASLRRFPRYVDELHADGGIDPGLCEKPTLVVARDRDDTEALERLVRYQQSVGLEPRWLTADEVHQRAPHLRNIEGGVECPSDYFVDTDRLTDALVAACQSWDVELLEGCSVRSILRKNGAAQGVELSDGRKFFAHRTVVCAGAWSLRIEGIPEFSRPVLRPIRGQTVIVDASHTPLIDRVVRSPDVYLVPRDDGRIIIGSTMEEKGFDPDVTAGAVRTLLDEAWQILPGIDEMSVRALSSGFRPVSLDGRPIIGTSRLDGLYIAGGHGRHGILLAPITGQVFARLFRHPQLTRRNYRAFRPDRFLP